MSKSSRSANNNRSNQMNPNNEAYHSSRRGSVDGRAAVDDRTDPNLPPPTPVPADDSEGVIKKD